MMKTLLLLLAAPLAVDAVGYCNDKTPSCAGWAKAGHCEAGDHIKAMCPHSCAACPRDESPAQ